MWLSTTGGEDEMKGRSWRSPTPNPSKPSSSANTARRTTSSRRSVVDFRLPVRGSGRWVMRVRVRNFTSYLQYVCRTTAWPRGRSRLRLFRRERVEQEAPVAGRPVRGYLIRIAQFLFQYGQGW